MTESTMGPRNRPLIPYASVPPTTPMKITGIGVVSPRAMTMGLDVFHTQRELERVIQQQWKQAERQLDTASQADAKVQRYRRQGRDPRGVSGVAGRAWHKAERLFDQAVHAQEAVHQIAAALSWFDAQGRLYCRQTAQVQLDEASQRL